MKYNDIRERLFKMVSVGVVDDLLNQSYDIISTAALVINIAGTVLNTYAGVRTKYGGILAAVEAVTVLFFAIDYVLRLMTAPCLYPDVKSGKATIKYILSFAGIIDAISFLPYYLPFFFPAGAAVFRMFRVARIMRLFRINAYYDSMNVITEVLVSKKQQLLSSVFIIMVLMLASSLCMYSVENAAQPEVFANAFSGIWWAASTLLTVGYGDIYPVTTIGKLMGMFIAFLGVGVVAIPTGIISAGFVEQYQRLKRIGEFDDSDEVSFIKVKLMKGDSWIGKQIREIMLPGEIVVAGVIRGKNVMLPKGDLRLKINDFVIIGAEAISDEAVGLAAVSHKE